MDDGPALALRARLKQGVDLTVVVGTADGRSVPPNTTVMLLTPSSLRRERHGEAVLDYRIGPEELQRGEARFKGLPYLIWGLSVAAPNHRCIFREITLAPPSPDNEASRIEVKLDEWSAISAIIVGPSGETVSGCAIGVRGDVVAELQGHHYHSTDRHMFRGRASAMTDVRGACLLEGLPPDSKIVLDIRHPNFPNKQIATVAPPPGAAQAMHIQLSRPASIVGRLDMEAFADSAEKIAVHLYHVDGNQASSERRIPSERDGAFAFRNVRVGEKIVSAVARDGADLVVGLWRTEVPEGERVDLGLLLPTDGPELSILVQVDEPYPADAQVRMATTVHLVHEGVHDREHGWPTDFVLDIGTQTRIRGIPPGSLVASLHLIDRDGRFASSAHKDVGLRVLPKDRHLPIEAIIPRAARQREQAKLRIRLSPPPGAKPSSFVSRMILLDTEGTVVGGYPWPSRPGAHKWTGYIAASDAECRLVALGEGWMSGPAKLGTLRGRKPVAFDKWTRAATLRLSVVDSKRRQPIKNAEVRVFVATDEVNRALAASTGEDGLAEFTLVPGESVWVDVVAEGYTPATRLRIEGSDLDAGMRVPRRLELTLAE